MLGALTLLFVLISWWWIATDTAPPDIDGGSHLDFAHQYHDMLVGGEWGAWWDRFDIYTPFVHLVGAVGFIGAVDPVKPMVLANVVFVPMLTLGCYWAGEVAYGRWAGLLAAAFALAAPMVISMFHLFLLDGPLAATVALSIGLLLKSERFARPGWTVAAGFAVGIGLMTKNSFPAFVAGTIVVLLIRGGWRRWRNLILFAIPPAIVAGPWYIAHWGSLTGLAGERANVGHLWYANVPYPSRWSIENYTWYGWNLVNNQLYLPLTLLFAVGLVLALMTFVRRWRERDSSGGRAPLAADYTPELVVGLVAGYLLISQLYVDDPRYSLPILVFCAVLGTGWIVGLRRPRVRWAVVGAFCALVVLNTVATTFGAGPSWQVRLPNWVDSPIQQFAFRVTKPDGYVRGEPDTDAKLLDRFRALHAAGVTRVTINTGDIFMDPRGFAQTIAPADIGFGADAAHLSPQDVFVYSKPPAPGLPPACGKLPDGAPLFYVRGSEPPRPYTSLRLTCPGDAAYPAGLQPPPS